MELIIIIVAGIAIIIVSSMMSMNLKELKKIALDDKLNGIAKKYPRNTEICKAILQQCQILFHTKRANDETPCR